MSKIIKLTNIQKLVKKEKMDICVVSYGGCASNTLVKRLEDNGYRCKTDSWKKLLCHCPKIIDIDIPIIYIFENPIKAFLSQKRRRAVWSINQEKMSNNKNVKDKSDEKLLRLMIKQFKNWIKHERNPKVLIVNTSEIFNQSILHLLKTFLKKKNLKHFPIHYREPSINIKTIQELPADYINLFKKYSNQIGMIITKGNELITKRMKTICNSILNKHKFLLDSIKKDDTYGIQDDKIVDDSFDNESLSDDSLSDESLSNDSLSNDSFYINIPSEHAMMVNTDYVLTEPITLTFDIH